MCLGVFIASDHPLTLVPWDPDRPAFNVVPLSAHEEPVRQQLSLPQVVYAGAHTDCSCGFRSDEDEPAAVARSRGALIAYLERAMTAGAVELYVCWEGEYGESVRARSERSVTSLAHSDDWLEERTFTRVTPPLAYLG